VREVRVKAQRFPNEADRKVFLLKNVQDMTVQAQNALLKLLEEPPASVVFVLTCENKSVLLETIRSRVATIALHSQSEAEANSEAAQLWQSLTGGSQSAALALLSTYDRDRKGFEALLAATRRVLEALVLSGERPGISPLRLLGIIDIIDEIMASSALNGNVSLLGSVFFARATDVLNK
jgi:DNA polymerase-3 subunit delta'